MLLLRYSDMLYYTCALRFPQRRKGNLTMNDNSASQPMNESNIFEPLSAFKGVYKDKFDKNASDYFDDLTKRSNIDIEANRKTNREIVKATASSEKIGKSISTRAGLRVFLIVLIVISFIAAIVGIYLAATDAIGDILVPTLLIVLGAVLIVLFFILIFLVINPKLKSLRAIKKEQDSLIAKLKSEAWAQMEPLNKLFVDGTNIRLFKLTIPLINLDKTFDSRRLDYLVNKFKLGDVNDIDRSTLYVQSGDIIGNPFFFARDLVHHLGTKTYSGSITITWTTSSYVNGKLVTQHHSQVLTAYVTKPCPYYHKEAYLVYGNEAAPDLIFSRVDSDAEILDDKQIQKVVTKEEKKLKKQQDQSLKKGGTFTVMGNTEFDVLWGAKDRNNEVQFRLLFTPLAQKQLLELMKDKTVGYGDNFNFIKHKMINVIQPDHLATTTFDISASTYQSMSYDVTRNVFLNENNKYFKDIYFAFAPILAIPIYQQHKPHEYIYKDKYASYVSFYEHEKVANAMNEDAFTHPLSKTRNILKTSTVSSGGFVDTLKVTAYGYDTVRHVERVLMSGRDGKSHYVPVEWIEYIPVKKESLMEVGVVEEQKEETYAEKIKKMFESLKNKDNSLKDGEIILVGSAFLARLIKSSKKDK